MINARSICNKTHIIKELVKDNDYDIMAITETWLKDENGEVINELTPPGYAFKSINRKSGKGGGVGLLHKVQLNVKVSNEAQNSADITTFEFMKCSMKINSKDYNVIIIYRPPPTQLNGFKTQTFFEELTRFLENNTITTPGKLVICGDFNCQMNKANDGNTLKMNTILNELNLHQNITEATHNSGNMLDLLITRRGETEIEAIEVMDVDISDHYMITCKIKSRKPTVQRKVIQYRQLNKIDGKKYRMDIESSLITRDKQNVNQLVQRYNGVLSRILNEHAPVISKEIVLRHECKWYSDDLLKSKRERRRLERKWKLTRNEEDKIAYKQQIKVANREIIKAKSNYFCSKINECHNDQRTLYSLINEITNNKRVRLLPTNGSSIDICNRFSKYFVQKIDNIRDMLMAENIRNPQMVTQGQNYEHMNVTALEEFEPLTLDQTQQLLAKSKNKCCDLDPMPTSMIKEYTMQISPTIMQIINSSLNEALVPDQLKQALVSPTIKKPSLDANMESNYRPISNLSFISKLLEKTVLDQLNRHMKSNNLWEKMQSAYKEGHSTETALIKIHNDIALEIDGNKSVILVLLDLSAAFDTVNHEMLLNRLKTRFFIKGKALEWFRSYVTNRHQSVKINNVNSVKVKLSQGVPQGSILGPVLFTSYTAPLREIAAEHEIEFHCYADDIQLYCSFNSNDQEQQKLATVNMQSCILDIKLWMRSNHLKLNESKTELMVITKPSQRKYVNDFTLNINESVIVPTIKVRNLGVMFDNELSMTHQVQKACQNANTQIRSIYRIRKFITEAATKTLVHALVLSKLDYSNALLFGIPKKLLNKLQRIQNSAARLITRTPKFDHITPSLIKLHWLPMEQRVIYKIILIVYKSTNGLGADYIMDMIQQYQPGRALRSEDLGKLVEPNYNTTKYGARAFANFSPRLWNEMPRELRTTLNLSCFKKQLKTYLFNVSYKDYFRK